MSADSVTFGLVSGDRNPDDGEPVLLTIAPNDDGLHVAVHQPGETLPVYSQVHSPEFFGSRTERKEVANSIEDRVSGVNPSEVKKTFKRVCCALDDRYEDEYADKLRSPTVQRVLDETERVDIFGGEDTTTTVYLSHGGETKSIDFSEGEFMGNGTGKLRNRYYGLFFEALDLDGDSWDTLRDKWIDMAEVVSVENHSAKDLTVERTVRSIQHLINPVADKERFAASDYAAFFEVDGISVDGQTEDVVWVQNDVVAEQLEDAGESANWIGTFAREAKKDGHLLGNTAQRAGLTAYPFNPETLDVSGASIVDDDVEVEP